MYRFMVEDLGIVGVDVGEGSGFTNYILSNIKTVSLGVIASYRM